MALLRRLLLLPVGLLSRAGVSARLPSSFTAAATRYTDDGDDGGGGGGGAGF